MKKREINLVLIIIFASIMILTSCTHYVVKTVHNEMYTDMHKQEAYTDVYTQLKAYTLDSIPPTQWKLSDLHSKRYNDEISENILRKIVDKKTCYIFIFTEYVKPDGNLYQFTIRYYGREK